MSGTFSAFSGSSSAPQAVFQSELRYRTPYPFLREQKVPDTFFPILGIQFNLNSNIGSGSRQHSQ